MKIEKITKGIILTLIVGVCGACNNSVTTKTDVVNTDTIVKDSVVTNQTIALATESNDNSVDTIAHIEFNELSIAINHLILFEQEKISKIQTDSVNVYAEIGETIESQLVSVSSDQLTDLTVEQRYETSITINDAGPHCDLTEWKHFCSDWKQLQANGQGQFRCDKYTEMEYKKFPDFSIDELKQEVKRHCGEGWTKRIEETKT